MEAEILALWNREAPALRRYFRMALNGDVEAAEDLTAESFTQLARALGRGTVDNAEALLRTIAKRRLIDEIHRRQDDPERPLGLLTNDEEYDLPRFTPDTLEAAEFRADFDAAVRALPRPERDVFILTHVRGLSTEEAGHVLGFSQHTASRMRQSATDDVRRALLAG